MAAIEFLVAVCKQHFARAANCDNLVRARVGLCVCCGLAYICIVTDHSAYCARPAWGYVVQTCTHRRGVASHIMLARFMPRVLYAMPDVMPYLSDCVEWMRRFLRFRCTSYLTDCAVR
jgi:hypothetical protein